MSASARNTRALQLAARREQFLAAAERMFLKDGFAKTSVNAIVREAGGSLATLYAEFGTKEALFESVLSQRATRFFPEARPRHITGQCNAEEKLRRLAAHMLQRMLSEDALAVYRICVHEAPRFPGLRKAILEAGIPGLQQGTARYITDLATMHSLRIEDPDLAASQFVALVQGQLVLMGALGATIDSRTRERQVTNAVHAFLKLYPACDGKRD
jgi:AcrR family transcriptional regulator